MESNSESVSHSDPPWVDYGRELNLSSSIALRFLFLSAGLVCVVLAVIGVFLPGWPTTVWLIVATYCFARSSPRFYNTLMNHRVFGPLIRDYRSGRGIPLRAKILAVSMIVLFAGSSALFVIHSTFPRVSVALAGTIGVLYLLRIPTRRRIQGGSGDGERGTGRGEDRVRPGE